MDPIASFEHILDNLPNWKTQLTDLSSHAIKKHDEYVAEYSRLLHKVRAKRTKSASLASLHTTDREEEAEAGAGTYDQPQPPLKSPQPSELVEISPLEAGNRFIYAQAHRKRKPGTSLRSNASGPRNYRSKQMVVVYYDSHIQSELDTLVKGFGAARNNLRKGKNAYNAAKGFTLPSLSRRHEAADGLVYNPMAKSGPRLPKAQSDPAVVTMSNPSTGEAAFQRADKELEVIQSLCENAAHQVIRDGDCKIELSDATIKLDSLLALTQSTLELLRIEKKKKDEEEAQVAERGSVSDNTSTQSTLCEKPSIEAFGLHSKTLPPLLESLDHSKRPPLPTTVSAPSGLVTTDTIEVDDDEDDDDDDDSSIEIDLNLANYRAASRPRIMAS